MGAQANNSPCINTGSKQERPDNTIGKVQKVTVAAMKKTESLTTPDKTPAKIINSVPGSKASIAAVTQISASANTPNKSVNKPIVAPVQKTPTKPISTSVKKTLVQTAAKSNAKPVTPAINTAKAAVSKPTIVAMQSAPRKVISTSVKKIVVQSQANATTVPAKAPTSVLGSNKVIASIQKPGSKVLLTPIKKPAVLISKSVKINTAPAASRQASIAKAPSVVASRSANIKPSQPRSSTSPAASLKIVQKIVKPAATTIKTPAIPSAPSIRNSIVAPARVRVISQNSLVKPPAKLVRNPQRTAASSVHQTSATRPVTPQSRTLPTAHRINAGTTSPVNVTRSPATAKPQISVAKETGALKSPSVPVNTALRPTVSGTPGTVKISPSASTAVTTTRQVNVPVTPSVHVQTISASKTSTNTRSIPSISASKTNIKSPALPSTQITQVTSSAAVVKVIHKPHVSASVSKIASSLVVKIVQPSAGNKIVKSGTPKPAQLVKTASRPPMKATIVTQTTAQSARVQRTIPASKPAQTPRAMSVQRQVSTQAFARQNVSGHQQVVIHNSVGHATRVVKPTGQTLPAARPPATATRIHRTAPAKGTPSVRVTHLPVRTIAKTPGAKVVGAMQISKATGISKGQPIIRTVVQGALKRGVAVSRPTSSIGAVSVGKPMVASGVSKSVASITSRVANGVSPLSQKKTTVQIVRTSPSAQIVGGQRNVIMRQAPAGRVVTKPVQRAQPVPSRVVATNSNVAGRVVPKTHQSVQRPSVLSRNGSVAGAIASAKLVQKAVPKFTKIGGAVTVSRPTTTTGKRVPVAAQPRTTIVKVGSALSMQSGPSSSVPARPLPIRKTSVITKAQSTMPAKTLTAKPGVTVSASRIEAPRVNTGLQFTKGAATTNITPQKRRAQIPPEALAAAMRAAAAVEPTPPLQSDSISRVSTMASSVAPRVARPATVIQKKRAVHCTPTKLSTTPVRPPAAINNKVVPSPVRQVKRVIATATPQKPTNVVVPSITKSVAPITTKIVKQVLAKVSTAPKLAPAVARPAAPIVSQPAPLQAQGATAPNALPAASAAPPVPARIPPGMTFQPGEHVTMWNRIEKRKIAGNAAPLGKNVEKYLQKHPECEVYVDQANYRQTSRSSRKRPKVNKNRDPPAAGDHVSIWNKAERRKIAGNASPLAKNLQSYLQRNPDCEVYEGQDQKNKQKSKPKAVKQEPSPAEETPANDQLDAWKDLSTYVDQENMYRMDYESAADLLYKSDLMQGDENDFISPVILEGPLGLDDTHIPIDLDRFINGDHDDYEQLDFFDGALPPLQNSLEIPNSS